MSGATRRRLGGRAQDQPLLIVPVRIVDVLDARTNRHIRPAFGAGRRRPHPVGAQGGAVRGCGLERRGELLCRQRPAIQRADNAGRLFAGPGLATVSHVPPAPATPLVSPN